MMKNRIALIPAYEPDEGLIPFLQEIKENGFDIVVVNDGSSEDTKKIFEEANAYGSVLVHPVNLGKGQALKTGLSFIKNDYPAECVIVTMDADGQHRVKDAVKIAEEAEAHPDALILGSRKFKGDVPLRSRFGNRITRLVYRLSTGLKVEDTQTGLRAFSYSMIPFMLEISGERYEYEMNVLLACSKNHVEIIEKEIDTVYLNDNASSHFDTIKDSFLIYREILRFSCASLISFCIDYGLFSMLAMLTSSLTSGLSLGISNICARIVSASVNYTLNRKLVFNSDTDLAQSIFQYIILAGFILAGNTAVLTIFVNSFGMNRYAAKIMTEIIFFFVSWFIQHQYIFQKEQGGTVNVSKAS